MSYHVKVEDFEGIQHQWESILPFCSTNTIFVTPRWQKIWWRHFGEGSELHILSVRDGDEVVGVAPLMLRDGVVSFVGDDDLFDYNDFLVIRGKEAGFYNVLGDYLAELDWQTLELTSLPEGSPTLRYLPLICAEKDIPAELADQEMTPVARLDSSWDDYLARLGKKSRHELRRKLRRLEGANNARQYVCDSRESLEGCMQDFFRLLTASNAEKKRFLTPDREMFLIDVAMELTPVGQLKLYFLEVGGVRVASCICLDYAESYMLYNSGYDPDYSSLSVGLLNKAFCIKEAIEEGRHSFNFLKGTERYKYDLGGRNRPVYSITARR